MHIQEKRAELGAYAPSVTFIGLSTRNWPLALQSKYVGLGEYSTGALAAPPHLTEATVRLKLRDSELNRLGFLRMNYSPGDADDLVKGGLLSVNASELARFADAGMPFMLGGLPLNEFNISNPPAVQPVPEDEGMPGFFMDRHYQSWFQAAKPGCAPAYYGAKNDLFRDHFEQARRGLEIIDSYRAKHYSIPVVLAHDRDELLAIAERFRQFEGQEAWYRGQTTHYWFERPANVARLLYGQDVVRELSLPGAAPRRDLVYEDVHPVLQLLVQDHMYARADGEGRDLEEVHVSWRSEFTSWARNVMALAQHYGIPTHGLDITSSIEVALWFATNRYSDAPGGRKTYVPMTAEDWPSQAARWPAIYIILPVTHSLRPSVWTLETDNAGAFEALRPRRQKGAFFMGAHGAHQNRMAEAVACIVRLAPGDWPCRVSYRELFPTPEEDPAAAFMLDVKMRHGKSALAAYFGEIAEYAYT